MKHKHYDCIVALAEGKNLEFAYPNFPETYHDAKVNHVNPLTQPELLWRIKKEPVIEVKYFYKTNSGDYKLQMSETHWHLKITYQDGKAIKAEVAE